jgi:hypothetical protein
MSPKAYQERRAFSRFSAPEEAIVVDGGNIFRLLDVSKGGLSFRCLQEETLPKKLSVTIFYSDFSFRLKNVPIELRWEKADEFPSFTASPTKEVGLRFYGLDEYLKGKIDIFLTDIKVLES